MTLGPRLRKVVLTAHVTTSVGWLGAVSAVFVLAIAGLATEDAAMRRAVHLSTDLVAWSVLVPFAAASLITGVVQSLGSRWGLLRHYWVVFKLVITLAATAVLVAYTQTLATLADVAAQGTWSVSDVALLESPSVVLHAAVAVLLLVIATILAVFKPAGLTSRGRSYAAARAEPHN